MIRKEDLDKRICDCEPGATNTETYREFIIHISKELFGQSYDFLDFEDISEEELNKIINELDWLLEKWNGRKCKIYYWNWKRTLY